MTTTGQPAIPSSFVLYDGDCPVCRSYMALARLREQCPDVAVLDARQHPDLVRALRAEGFDVDESMVVRLTRLGRRPATYVGGEATRLIYELAHDGGADPSHSVRHSARQPIRHAMLWTIGGAPWRRALYPSLRGVRNLLIRALGKGKIG